MDTDNTGVFPPNGNRERNSTTVEENAPPRVTEDTSQTLPPPTPLSSKAQFTARPSDLVEVGAMLFQEAEEVLKGGRKRKLRLRLGRKSLAEIPLASSAVVVLATVMIAVAVTRLTIEVE
jgi:hypothetical protein